MAGLRQVRKRFDEWGLKPTKDDLERIKEKDKLKEVLHSKELVERLLVVKERLGIETDVSFASYLGCSSYEWRKAKMDGVGVPAINILFLIACVRVNPSYIFFGEEPVFIKGFEDEINSLKLKIFSLCEELGRI